MMTGRYAHRDWVGFGLLHPKARTFGHYLKDAGYRTMMAGKWQFTSHDPVDYPGAEQRRGAGMRAEDAGFDEYSLWHTGHTEDKGSRYADQVIFENGKFRQDIRGKYGDNLWTDYVNGFIERHRRGRNLVITQIFERKGLTFPCRVAAFERSRGFQPTVAAGEHFQSRSDG